MNGYRIKTDTYSFVGIGQLTIFTAHTSGMLENKLTMRGSMIWWEVVL